MTEVLRFSADPDSEDLSATAPVYVASILAINYERLTFAHSVVLVAADTEQRARDKALNAALRRWKLSDSWIDHAVCVMHLQSAVNQWLDLPPETKWITQ